jgi:hypothetical protein
MNQKQNKKQKQNRKQKKPDEFTFAFAKTIKIKGLKGVTQYIAEASKTVESIRSVFQADLSCPNAVVKEPYICRKGIAFRAHMCAVDHATLVHNTSLCYPSKVVSSEIDAVKTLSQLDELRKMFVTNNQERATTLKTFRAIIRKEVAVAAAAALAAANYGIPSEQELAFQNHVTVSMNQLVQKTKQRHLTFGRNLLTQFQFTASVMNQKILAYQHATETLVEKIIDHAKKCRAFIRECQRLAVIEYRASKWWFETQPETVTTDDMYNYYVSVGPDESNKFPHFEANSVDTLELGKPPTPLYIFVRGEPTWKNPTPTLNPLVNVYELDQVLADEAIAELECAQQSETCKLELMPESF